VDPRWYWFALLVAMMGGFLWLSFTNRGESSGSYDSGMDDVGGRRRRSDDNGDQSGEADGND
jgi:hypothetical protein